MRSKKFKVTMGNPCSFGWQNMTPEGKEGRHCAQCDKTVVDFTVMTDEQVVNYLLTHKNVCGHFNKSQLGRTMESSQVKHSGKKYWPAIAAMLVAGMFQVSTAHAQGNIQFRSTATIAHEDVEPNTDKNQNKTGIDNDSLTEIKVKVIDSKTKKQIPGATIEIPGLGTYTSDKNGYFKVSFCTATLPGKIRITAWASYYYYYTAEIETSVFIKNPVYNLEMWFDDPNMKVDGGDIYIVPEK